jgi:hypothetical protein
MEQLFVCSGEELGVVTHVHNVVFVKGVMAATQLKSHCAACPVYVSVTRNAQLPLLVSAPGHHINSPCVVCVQVVFLHHAELFVV